MVSQGLKMLDVPAPLVSMMFDIGVTGDLIAGGLLHGSGKFIPNQITSPLHSTLDYLMLDVINTIIPSYLVIASLKIVIPANSIIVLIAPNQRTKMGCRH